MEQTERLVWFRVHVLMLLEITVLQCSDMETLAVQVVRLMPMPEVRQEHGRLLLLQFDYERSQYKEGMRLAWLWLLAAVQEVVAAHLQQLLPMMHAVEAVEAVDWQRFSTGQLLLEPNKLLLALVVLGQAVARQE